MKITEIRLGRISVPLRVPFKTALRRVDSVEDIIVEIHTDEGAVGYGEAPPTGVITGDTAEAIIGAIRGHIAPALLGRDVEDFEDVIRLVQSAIVHNTSAKAAVDMALYDLYAMPPVGTSKRNNVFYSVSFILGTVQGGLNVMASGDYCATPASYSSAENFDYCAINKFNFAAEATGV